MKFKLSIIIATLVLIFVSSTYSLESKYEVSMDANYFELYETAVYEILGDSNVKVKKIDNLKFDTSLPLNISIEKFSFNETFNPFVIVKKESVACYDDLTNIRYPVEYNDATNWNKRIIHRDFEFICDIKDEGSAT